MSNSADYAVLKRRTLIKGAFLGALGASVAATPSGAAAIRTASPLPKVPVPDLLPPHRFGRVMQEYMVRRVREIERDGNSRRARLETKVDAERYVQDVRDRIQKVFGPWPKKTALNARVTGVLERDTYRLEKIIFESRPGFPVTANLYLPKGRSGPSPAVLCPVGHEPNGKAGAVFQAVAQGLARQGYVVFAMDPLGQGERVQYLTIDLQPRGKVGSYEHVSIGNQQVLVGESLASWFCWDGIRALDYLLARPEVDPRHVGVTGSSGGGTQSTWLAGVDPRVTMAAPSCFVTTLRRNLENEVAADSEQCPPRVLGLGLDHADFLIAMAPKPVLIIGQEKDFFDARGVEEAYQRVRHVYALLGAESNVKLFLDGDYHNYPQTAREAMCGWFNQAAGRNVPAAEPPLTIERDADLYCTPRGQVTDSAARNVFAFTQEIAGQLEESRRPLSGTALQQALVKLLNLPPRNEQVEYRILRPAVARRYPKPHSTAYAVETEPGVFAIVTHLGDAPLLSRPTMGRKRALLYVAHQSSDDELRRDPLLAELIQTEANSGIFACDVRGIGDSQPNTVYGDPNGMFGADYLYAAYGVMLNFSYIGQRTHDLLRVIDWLKGSGYEEVHLVGRGWGTVPATFAAVLADAVVQITLKHALTSYRAIAQTENYDCPLALMPPGILKWFDLPDCYRALSRKNLRLIDPTNNFGVAL